MKKKALPALLVLAFCLVDCSPPPPRALLRNDDVREQVQALQSICAEADLLARELDQHTVTQPFGWVQQQALAQQALQAAEALSRPAPAALHTSQQQALELAARLQDRVNQVAQSHALPGSLDGLRRQFAALKDEAQGLERAL